MNVETFLANAEWLFFTAWSLIVALVSALAFARDLFPSRKAAEGISTKLQRQ